MYLVTIQVPIYVAGRDRLLTTDWKRSLLLLRDSFDGHFGRLQVVAPSLDVRASAPEQPLEPLAPSDDIELFPSFPFDTRARDFWRTYLRVWQADVHARIPSADVVHSGFYDVYRPIDFVGFIAAWRAGKPSVFVQDTDHVMQQRELAAHKPLRKRLGARVYSAAYERCVRFGVKRASLSLLKGQALHTRYGRYAKNAKNFHDTSYLSHEIVPLERVERRIAELLAGQRPVRLVYCGRLLARKGLNESLSALALARRKAASVTLDIIGDGPERATLERQAAQLGIADTVTFHGTRVYSKQLLSDLADYDALLFTPSAEDTPRMIFDGYAAGLPVLGYGIEYMREREREDAAARCVPLGNTAAAAALLCSLDQQRMELAKLARSAHKAARYHAADEWYRRRAEWTYEAVARHSREPITAAPSLHPTP